MTTHVTCISCQMKNHDRCQVSQTQEGVLGGWVCVCTCQKSIFNEESLREDVIERWGPAGAHVDVLDMLITKAREADRCQTFFEEICRQYDNLQDWLIEQGIDYPNPGHPFT